MAIVANVTDGVLKYSYTDSSEEAKTASGSDMGYDQFLQLLCAEMQYQDPLEPTTNTDYVAQMATFSQLEATLSLENTEQNALASSMVGKQVILAVDDSATGKTNYVSGKVDYVMYQNGEVFLSVNNNLYPISSLDTVSDDGYYEAVSLSNTFSQMMAQFPNLDNVTATYEGAVKEARDMYNGLTDYQKNYIKTSDLETLKKLEDRVAELKKAAESAKSEE